ncbi:MAG: hypothetical protein UHS47_07575, partial [Oscillospiraceae bacterium]|nr:hypothetical protein [Oscillospiraceae bacterium]
MEFRKRIDAHIHYALPLEPETLIELMDKDPFSIRGQGISADYFAALQFYDEGIVRTGFLDKDTRFSEG